MVHQKIVLSQMCSCPLNSLRIWSICLIVGILSTVGFGCGTDTGNLSDIEANPQAYAGRTEPLHIQGKVVAFSILPNQHEVFRIEDDSGGSLWVSSAKEIHLNETFDGVGKIKIGLPMIDKAYGILFIENPPASALNGSEEEQTAEGETQ